MGATARALGPEPEDRVARLIAAAGELAVLPQVVCRITDVTGDESASATMLERAIQIDPGLSARILVQANSAYYALPRKVVSIRDAVILMGFKSVRELAMTVGVFDLFVGKSDKESLRRRSWWRNSLDAAVCARALAPRFASVQPDEAYTCGLLHLIGKTLLDRSDPAKYTKVQGVVDQGVPDVLAERAMFETDHVAVAVAAAIAWGFPGSLAAGLDYFTPSSGAEESPLRAVNAIASRIARIAVLGKPERTESEYWLPNWAMAALGLDETDVEELVTTGIQAVASFATMSI